MSLSGGKSRARPNAVLDQRSAKKNRPLKVNEKAGGYGKGGQTGNRERIHHISTNSGSGQGKKNKMAGPRVLSKKGQLPPGKEKTSGPWD